MVEAIILIVVLAVTVGILWLAKRHGIVMRPEADGLAVSYTHLTLPTTERV